LNRFPDELTVDEVHQMVNEGNWLEFETFSELDAAKHFQDSLGATLSERQAQVYTQVDAEGDVVYLRGEHLVNRAGVYLVAWA